MKTGFSYRDLDMTMANTTTVPSPHRSGVSLRKTNKPLMEKRRRARINDSLSQLKSLVIQSSKKDSSQFNKLEKADILELTVKHLRHLQDQQVCQASSSNTSLAGKYQAGFMECANEVIRYLGQSQGFTDEVKSRVVHHLASCIQLSNKISIAKSTSAQPVPTPSAILPAGIHVTNGQYSNGQLIQIVHSKLQQLKSSNMNTYPGVQSVPASSTAPTAPVAGYTSIAAAPTVASYTSIAAAPATNCSTPSQPPPNLVKYSQPLQIQIPPVLSPLLIQSKSNQHHKSHQQQIMHKPQDAPSQLHPHPITPKEKMFSAAHPQVQPLPALAARTCEKPLKYYPCDDQYHEFSPRTRTCSLTSSSPTSSESELSSPLNLSQSPKHYDHRETNPTHPSPRQTSNLAALHHAPLAGRDTFHMSHCLSSNFASVIVDGRKAGDGHALSYLHFVEEDGHFVRHEGSTSPASSMGEDRLWRPW